MLLPRAQRSSRSRGHADSATRAHTTLTASILGLLMLVGAVALSDCGSEESGAGASNGGKLEVVAAENFWGSIAAQLGGEKVHVSSIIVDPDTDPHSYEPTARDARTMASAQIAIVNGIGYDEWASKLLAASPSSGRVVLNAGEVLGLKAGENPHQWYSPSHLREVIGAIAADYERRLPGEAEYFARRRHNFEDAGLRRYDALLSRIRERYAGVPVGYSESIFQPLGESLHLKLLTPQSFAKAIAEGTEITAQDKRVVDAQVKAHRIEVWVFNSQNVTPDVRRVNELAKTAGIPIATVTETLSPASERFQGWQAAQLQELADALHRATGR